MSFILVSDKSNYGCIDYLRFIPRFLSKFEELIHSFSMEQNIIWIQLGHKFSCSNNMFHVAKSLSSQCSIIVPLTLPLPSGNANTWNLEIS